MLQRKSRFFRHRWRDALILAVLVLVAAHQRDGDRRVGEIVAPSIS
jgi:hypothetical protein